MSAVVINVPSGAVLLLLPGRGVLLSGCGAPGGIPSQRARCGHPASVRSHSGEQALGGGEQVLSGFACHSLPPDAPCETTELMRTSR